jgi:hypothetical protein
MKKQILFLILLVISVLFYSCNKYEKRETKTRGEEAAYSPNKEEDIRNYNLQIKESQAKLRTPYDTLSLLAYVLRNYPHGTYLVDFDKTLTYNVPKPAVIYLTKDNQKYIFAVIVRSKPGERSVEPKNLVGYKESFINLDSTKLGTAFFYLTLFKCERGTFTKVWEDPIPSHGGFNSIELKKWSYNHTPYVKIDFLDALEIGHIDYNYFLIKGLTEKPHLLMTYKGIDFKRTLANVNNDRYPDYYEFLYYNFSKKIYEKDSVAFVWDNKDSLYVNTRNHQQTRPY